jgi:hypothetical protein
MSAMAAEILVEVIAPIAMANFLRFMKPSERFDTLKN